jgi:hypothetical protein
MGVDGICGVGDWASEGQAAGVYGAGFTAGSLAGKGARGTGNKVVKISAYIIMRTFIH